MLPNSPNLATHHHSRVTSALLLSEAPVTGRRQIDAGPLPLELGGALPDVEIAYETWGTPRVGTGGDIVNAILVLHALTGDAHVSGPSGPDQPTQGWWQGLIGPGAAIDPGDWFVVASNVLGGCRGTTGPSSLAPDGRAWGSRFPRLTIRDQVAAEARLADLLGIARFAAVIGGSMGGMRALEWVLCHPDRVGAVLALAVGGYATADQIGTQSTQIAAIHADPHWRGGDYYPTSGSVGQETNGPGAQLFGGPVIGLGIARRIAHLTYRSESELEHRFGRRPQQQEDPFAAGRFAIESYLEHHARKLADRFDAGSYVSLTQAMNTHDVGRDRGGVGTALARVTAPVVVAGIDTDRLYPLRLQQELADLIPTCGGLEVLTSAFGHDGFLIEVDAVANVVTKTLSLTAG